jgi:hypothetical protein
MEDEFNENYKLVEKHYPEAINKGTGKVKREKPAKVKKVKVKKATPAKSSFEDIKPPTAEIKKLKGKLSDDEIEGIEKVITDNKKLPDAELVALLVKHSDLTEAKAKKWVAKRTMFEGVSYKSRKAISQKVRQDKDTVETRDGHKFNRKDPGMKGKKFYDENGKQWTCKGYSVKLDECIMEDDKGKEISTCLRDMYVNNPVEKRGKGDMVDDCKDVLSKAGYTVKEHKTGKKKIRRREPRPEKEILKERVQDTFTPITKDLTSSEEKTKENKDVIEALERIQKLFVKLFNRLSNLADDGKTDAIGKIEKLLKELVGE